MKKSKISAAGNDFVVLGPCQTESVDPKLVAEICDRRLGIGADGVLVVTPEKKWFFYNADGSSAEFCGNGARALAYFENKFLDSPIEGERETPAGKLNFTVTEETVSLCYDRSWVKNFSPTKEAQNIVDDSGVTFVLSGVPHACFKSEAKLDYPPKKDALLWAKEKHEKLIHINEDMNFTFFQPRETNEVFAYTFERGIEGTTLACGSGALAAAFCHNPKGKTGVTMPGGRLEVIFLEHTIKQSGPVRFVAELGPTRWNL